MKLILFSLIFIISKILIILCSLWCLVEFVMFLSGKKTFNFDSLFNLVISVVFYLVSIIAYSIYHIHSEYEEKKRKR